MKNITQNNDFKMNSNKLNECPCAYANNDANIENIIPIVKYTFKKNKHITSLLSQSDSKF